MLLAAAVLLAVLLAGGSSRTTLASARLSCLVLHVPYLYCTMNNLHNENNLIVVKEPRRLR